MFHGEQTTFELEKSKPLIETSDAPRASLIHSWELYLDSRIPSPVHALWMDRAQHTSRSQPNRGEWDYYKSEQNACVPVMQPVNQIYLKKIYDELLYFKWNCVQFRDDLWDQVLIDQQDRKRCTFFRLCVWIFLQTSNSVTNGLYGAQIYIRRHKEAFLSDSNASL